MSVFDPIGTEEVETTRAFWQFQRFTVAHPIEYFSFEVDPGFGYLLRAATVRWDTVNLANAISPTISLEFLAASSVFPRQPSPVLADLLGTPAGRFIERATVMPNGVAAIGPVLGTTEIDWPRGSRKLLNFAFIENEVVQIKITGQSVQGGSWTPAYIDVLLEGYNVPERSMAVWGGK